MQAPLFQRSSRFGYRRWLRSGWLLVRLAPDTPHKARDGCDPACRRNSTSRDSRKVCCAGGRSFGIARHWHPVLKIYMIPFITSRTSTWRLLPPRLAGGIWFDIRPFIVGQVTRISQFAAVVTSAVLRRPHRGAPLESGHHFESQTIQRI